MVKMAYPISPELAQELVYLKDNPAWEALLGFLKMQEEAAIFRLKSNVGDSTDKAALTASAVSAELKLISRIRTMPEVAQKIVDHWRKVQDYESKKKG